MKSGFQTVFKALSKAALWPIFIAGLLLLLNCLVRDSNAAEIHMSGRLSPQDYLFGSQEQRGDPIFDKTKAIDLSARIGVGSDCGKINFQATLQSSLSKMLNGDYFAQIGKNIVDAGGMLSICYMSPTYCAILKHSQLTANFMSQMRLDQCSLIDKYVDSRVEDYYQERQSCVHRSIRNNGGDLESAMETCKSGDMWNSDLTDWSGSKNGGKATTNRLIDSSASWAGMNGKESQGIVNLVKSLVGDTVVSRGSVSVEYGPGRAPVTPRTYLQSLERDTYNKLCGRILDRIQASGTHVPIERIISDQELKDLSHNSEQLLVDRQTLRALAYMSPKQSERACRKLSDAAALTLFSNDVNRSLDVLSTLAQNPNLPPQRKAEIQEKRKALKDQIELTVALQKERSEPLNQVLAQIHEEGVRRQSEAVANDLSVDASLQTNERTKVNYFDCSDGVLCQ